MGVFDRIRGVGPDGYRAKAAERLELSGDLAGAVRAFIDAELPDEAARVLLLRADAEAAVDRRMAFCVQAAKVAKDPKIQKKATSRKALIRYDLVRHKSNAMRSEILAAAKELEEADENEAAAEAYKSVSDGEGEIRALTAAGMIDKLEEKLRVSHASATSVSRIGVAQKQIADLDRTGERRAALALAKSTLAEGSTEPGAEDATERIEMAARAIRAKLVRGPVVELRVDKEVRRYALGAEVTVGRGEATIVAPTRALSRVHLKIYRSGGQVLVEDGGTRNGTFLAGARLTSAIPVATGLSLKLGGEVPCQVRPDADGVRIDIGGMAYFAPLGPIHFGAIRIELDGRGGDDASYLVLRSSHETPAFLQEFQLAPAVELAVGDAPSATRSGAPLFTVLPGAHLE